MKPRVMAELSLKEVEEIALLARLQLTAEETERLRGELSGILGYIEKLRACDTSGVEPMTHAVPIVLRLRDDRVEPSLPVEVAVADAPTVRDGSFEVPAIIKSS